MGRRARRRPLSADASAGAAASAAANTPEATAATAQTRDVPTPSQALPVGEEVELSAKGGKGYLFGSRLGNAAARKLFERSSADPVYRPLRIYTHDPSTSRLEGATVVLNVPYETLDPGPEGANFAVVRLVTTAFPEFEAVDLNAVPVLIRSGLEPTPADPAFHHQMVYAVASSVYAAFRAALGRELGWGFGAQRLLLIPHAFELPQAMYSRRDRAILFGYFRADEHAVGRVVPGGWVFSCLSHDVIAHELTHALLDGLRPAFTADDDEDEAMGEGAAVAGVADEVDAFHEAFADLVPLFQRFSYIDVVRHAVRRTRGRLREDERLWRVASEFAHGSGRRTGIRTLDIGPDPKPFDIDAPPYELGEVLVAAIVEAFLTVYDRKAAPYLRAWSAWTGEPPDDLVDILAHIASRLASQFLNICIRAIDYSPVTAIQLGEYLRALITADRDVVPDDPWAYREALIDAFARRRIYPRDVKSLSEADLVWQPPDVPLELPDLHFAKLRFRGDPGSPADPDEIVRQARALAKIVIDPANLTRFGLAAPDDPALEGDEVSLPSIESIRSSRRAGPDGQIVFDLIAEVLQRRKVQPRDGLPGFTMPGGSTIVLGPAGNIRYIVKKSIRDAWRVQRRRQRLARQFDFVSA